MQINELLNAIYATVNKITITGIENANYIAGISRAIEEYLDNSKNENEDNINNFIGNNTDDLK